MAGAEPAGDAERGGEVRAGRGAGEDALVAGGLASRLERSGFGDGDDLVVVTGPELRRALTGAAALGVLAALLVAGLRVAPTVPVTTSVSSPLATGEAATATPALPPSAAPNPAGS